MVRLEQQLEAAEKVNPNCTGSVEGMIIVACQYYGVDSDIALAIARLETGNFTSAAFTECNNVGGMSIDEVPIVYRSLEDGVDDFVQNLAKNYFGKGYDTVEKIGKKYCPVNPNWAREVKKIMEENYDSL
ncbi:glucosaminidase domain-containing protein [Emergencia sp. 1XD21-10]|uniref:glucosaminidase domain-containing protein n=1 Tax=Emergencia sp. 1XD21-10 TaxID=2304569 RepID=UPI00137B29E5|nr:glucosaminidase domain-containing protein [Emergencia sp. 1XD21-10]NCE98439.1 hypothetical protein [Emergencia sp. 1XD21-10]